MTSVSGHRAGRGHADRAQLANALRAARGSAGLGGAAAGKQAGFSQSKISKIERGFLLPAVADVAALCEVYQVPASERDHLLALAGGLRDEASTRVTLARRVPEMQRRIGQLEKSAALVRSFQPTMVIGLLQTSAYARYVFGIPDSRALSAEAADEAVAGRARRQLVLADAAKRFVLIMTEGALRWQAGSAHVMAEQLDVLADATTSPSARVGIIPWTTPVRHFPRHGFHLYDSDAVIVGTETATATITGTADIAIYAELFTALEQVTSFGEDARTHLHRIADDYRALATGP
jgi:transcriptional regulator with XRE-family HTH domain